MPKSARNKVVSLTRIEKKGRERKAHLADELRGALDAYEYVWVLEVENMRNLFLKEIRQAWQGSRLLFGRAKLMQKVMGHTAEDEYLENLHLLSAMVSGEVGILLTNESPDVVRDWFASFVKTDFARSGQESPLEFVVPEGIVYSTGGRMPQHEDVPLTHALEATMRQLGMPTRLVAGKVVLSEPYTVCRAGDVLDSRQTRLLKQFGVACADFRVNLRGGYSKKDATLI